MPYFFVKRSILSLCRENLQKYGDGTGSHEKAGEDPAGIHETMFLIYGKTVMWYNICLAVEIKERL